ncbi:PhzF family phenazine biosynthesis protein [Pseudomonas sp. DC3000-4b1]|uniref:PhzF family phenazine biosynthesis protein n=1 Tax=unclassified Pseudomonas TaxID=196821 RepID=UPI003CE9F9DA
MQLDYHQVDAFSDRPFGGNPTIVYRLERWLPDDLLQQIATEHNLSQTVFIVKEGSRWRIRWFAPRAEVPLCGHGTLAAAHVLQQVFAETADTLEFTSRSGLLTVMRDRERLWLNLPAQYPDEEGVSLEIQRALNVDVIDVLGANELFVVVASEQALRQCQPDPLALGRLLWSGVVVTARGERHDFVSRFFAPGLGIPEDGVTASTHASLVPYWARRLGKTSLSAYQCSARGGELACRLVGDSVQVGGHMTLVASGRLLVGL